MSSARSTQLRFAFAYSLMMIGNGIQLPFLPLWLQAQGLTITQNASVVAAMTVIRVFGAPLFTTIADATGKRLTVVRLTALATALSFCSLNFVGGYHVILGLAALAAFFLAPYFPIVEGYGVEATAKLGLDYGKIRIWGSLGFLVASLVAGGLLKFIPTDRAMILIAVGQSLPLLAALLLPPEPPRPSHHVEVSPVTFRDALRFLFASRFTVFLLAAGLASCSHGMIYAVGSLYWHDLGYDPFQISLLWSMGTGAEALLFFFSMAMLKRIPVAHLLCFSLAGAVVRWFGTSLATGFATMILLQTLHCISFATMHLALMHFIRLNVPVNLRNTAQGFYAAVSSGLLLGGTTWAGGPLYDTFGGQGFLLMGSIASLGFAVAVYNLGWLTPTRQLAVQASGHSGR